MPKGILKLIFTASIVMLAACSDDVTPDPKDMGPGEGKKPDVGAPDLKKDTGPAPDADGAVTPPDKTIPDKCVLGMKINGAAAKDATAYSSLDDKDKVTTGLQVEVEIGVTGTTKNPSIDLTATGQTKATKTSASGKATFTVTLDPKSAPITMEASATGCTKVKVEKLTVTVDPTCTFVTPDANTNALYQKDNEDSGGTGFKYTIKIKTTNALNGSVDLTVDGAAAQPSSTVKPDSVGVAIFKGTQLKQNVQNEIKATVTVTLAGGKLTGTCTPAKGKISVDTTIPKCDCCGFNPAPKGIVVQPLWGIGPLEDKDKNPANGVQTEITITTDSKKVDSVSLNLGDGSAIITKKVTGDKVTFPVTVKEGLHTMSAACENTTTKAKGTGSFKILVDVTKPKAVTDLVCEPKGAQHRKGEATCTWTAAVDPGTAPAGVKQYYLRYLKNAKLAKANWDGATTTKLVVPAAPTTNTKVIDKLTMPNSYFSGIKAEDHLGNLSDGYFPTGGAKIDFKTTDIVGTTAGQNLGNSIAVGDFNCDGIPDLAVGLFLQNSKKGEVQLFFGTGSGFPKVASKKITGTQTFGYFGYSLAALNFDNDTNKCDDLAVLALGANSFKGRIYLFMGRPVWKDRTDEGTGTGAEIYYQVDPATAGAKDKLYSKVGAADLDGDGAMDLAMGYLGATDASVLIDYGEKNIPLMKAGQAPEKRLMPTKADIIVNKGLVADGFGFPLVRGGKLNSDNYEELLIGAYKQKVGTAVAGGAYVLLGKARGTGVETIDVTSSARVIHIKASATNKNFGGTMAGVGDLDGDGTAEFAISDYRGGAGEAGQVYVFNLKTTNPASVTDAKAIYTNDLTTTNKNWFGRSIANGVDVMPKVADLNGDSRADMVVGLFNTGALNSGSAKIFYGPSTLASGKASTADLTLQPTSASTVFSFSSAFLTDINKDGHVDVVISDHVYSNGRGRVLVYY